MAHQEYFAGKDALDCLKELLSRPPADWPLRVILSVKRGDVQLYVKVRKADELEIIGPDGEVVEDDDE